MNIIGVQLLLLGFGLFMMYMLFLHWKKRSISNRMFGSWAVIWIVFSFFALFPQLLESLIGELFIVRVMDLAVIVTFMILAYLTFENNVKMKKYEEQLEKLVRKLAIRRKEP